MAMPSDKHAQCLTCVREAFQPLGLTAITMWNNFSGRSVGDLSEYHAIFIGSGCTYRLMGNLNEDGFYHRHVDYIRQGCTVYGGSAGAIISGVSIETCAHIDRNICGLVDFRGLNLIN